MYFSFARYAPMPRLLFPALAFLLAAAAQPVLAATEANVDRTMTVNGPVTLSVQTGSGNIHIAQGAPNTVSVHMHIRARGWFNGGAEDRVKQIVDHPPIDQSGNIIRLGRKDNDWGSNVSIDYDVTTPPQTSLSANTGSGNIHANGLTGEVKVSSGSGDIVLEAITGNASANTGSGNVNIANLSGAAKLEAGSGDLTLSQAARGDVQARTGSGNIRLTNAQDSVHAHTGSGDLTVAGNPGADWRLGTGSGNLDLHLGPGSKFNLDASTGSGNIRCEQPLTMQGALNRHHVHGSVNGGGPAITVETGSGDVHIY